MNRSGRFLRIKDDYIHSGIFESHHWPLVDVVNLSLKIIESHQPSTRNWEQTLLSSPRHSANVETENSENEKKGRIETSVWRWQKCSKSEPPQKKHPMICEKGPFLSCYCWWKKSCTTWDVQNLVKNGIHLLSTGEGFFPSTVSS